MKITRSTLKSLIKEEMNRINEAPTRISDEDGMHFSPNVPPAPHPMIPSELPDNMRTPLVWTADDIGAAGILISDTFSAFWPPVNERHPIHTITLVFPASDEEKEVRDEEYTGKTVAYNLLSGTSGMSQIAAMIETQNPDLFAAMEKAAEGQAMIKQGNAEAVDGGWVPTLDDSRQGDSSMMSQRPDDTE